MTPEASEILRKWLDDGLPADWLTPAELAIGTAVRHVTLRGPEIVTTRIEAEGFYLMPDSDSEIFNLRRRRESVSADEVIAKIREVTWQDRNAERFGKAIIDSIETTINEICSGKP